MLGECPRRRILVNDLNDPARCLRALVGDGVAVIRSYTIFGRHALGIRVGGTARTALQNHIVVKGWELIGAETAADAFGYATKFRISSASSVLRCFARLAS